MIRAWAFGLLLVLAACAHSGGGGHGAGVLHATRPPGDYAFIGSVEGTETKDVQVGMNSKVLGDGAGDGRLTVLFGVEMLGAIAGATPARSHAGGDGDNHARPIAFDPAPGREALKAAMNDLVARYPDRRDVKGYLFRSPSGQYLLYAVFDTGMGPGALYYDVTSWAEALKKVY